MAGRSGPKRSGTTSSGLPTKIARSRTPGKRAMCLIISALWSAVRSASCWPPSGIGSQPTKSVIQVNAVRFSSGFSCSRRSTSQASSPTTRSYWPSATASWKTMKLASRISSMRRMAWKACRSCSADSDWMWADSLASSADAGWTRSPASARTRVTGSWASQSTSRSGRSLRSSAAIATSRWAWPRPMGEETYSARGWRRSALVQVCGRGGPGGSSDWTNLRNSRLKRLRVGLEPPADAVLDRLGGVPFGERLAEEELEELPVVLAPVVLVVLGPPLGCVQPLGEAVQLALGIARPQRQRGADEDDARHALRVQGAELQRPVGAGRQRHQHRAVRARGVHHRQRVGGELGRQVGVGPGRPVGAAVAAPVEGDHPVAPGQVGHLHPPVPRVDDRPGRQQQHRRLAVAEHLVVELDAVALDVAVTDWLAGAHCSAPRSVVRPTNFR